jgi:hypothetical protein
MSFWASLFTVMQAAFSILNDPHNVRAAPPRPSFLIHRQTAAETDEAGPQQKHKCSCGGGCPRCEQNTHSHLQTKLVVGDSGDHYEQEADRVADQVMHQPAAGIQPTYASCSTGSSECLRSKSAAEGVIQRQTEGASAGSDSESDNMLGNLGPGQPLDEGTRTFFEPRFGLDFSQGRLHVDAQAAESARSVNALAYTVGRNVVFGAGQYDPHSMSGRRLLAHELSHVVQQGGGLATSPSIPPIQRSEIRLSRQTVSPTAPPAETPDPKLVRLEEAKALRIETLVKAIRELRQVEIAVEKQATPQQLWEFFGPTIWPLMLWVKVNVGDPAFADSIHEALRLMRANLNLTSEIHVVPDDVRTCGMAQGVIAFFNGNNAYICERSLTRNRTCLAASIAHELYHVVGLTHPGELGNHCATMERNEAMTNPYCITDLTFQIAWGADNTWSARC